MSCICFHMLRVPPPQSLDDRCCALLAYSDNLFPMTHFRPRNAFGLTCPPAKVPSPGPPRSAVASPGTSVAERLAKMRHGSSGFGGVGGEGGDPPSGGFSGAQRPGLSRTVTPPSAPAVRTQSPGAGQGRQWRMLSCALVDTDVSWYTTVPLREQNASRSYQSVLVVSICRAYRHGSPEEFNTAKCCAPE